MTTQPQSGPFVPIESQVWRRDDGRTASPFGACPWTTESERPRWALVSRGWTTLDTRDGTTGHGHGSLPTREEALARCDRWNAALAERVAYARRAVFALREVRP